MGHRSVFPPRFTCSSGGRALNRSIRTRYLPAWIIYLCRLIVVGSKIEQSAIDFQSRRIVLLQYARAAHLLLLQLVHHIPSSYLNSLELPNG
jgi:hypothetical protein